MVAVYMKWMDGYEIDSEIEWDSCAARREWVKSVFMVEHIRFMVASTK